MDKNVFRMVRIDHEAFCSRKRAAGIPEPPMY